MSSPSYRSAESAEQELSSSSFASKPYFTPKLTARPIASSRNLVTQKPLRHMDRSTDDMRLHCLGADCRDPVKHSHSDFIYAVAPVLGRCLDKIKGLDERTLKLKELVRLYDLVWEAWSEVWDTPYYTKKGLIKDIKAEYSLHTQLVRLREKVQEYENVDWETALEQAVKGSRFDRWADDDYLNALWPPAPPPSPTPYELCYRPWEEMVAELMAEDIENMNEKFRKQEEAEARAKERAENAWENSWNH